MSSPNLHFVDISKQDYEMNAQGRELEFTDWLLNKMIDLNLNQSQLARQMGKGRSYVNKLINGSYKLTFENAKLLSKALRLPLSEILVAAGMLPPVQNLKDNLADRFSEILAELPEEDIDELYNIAILKLERKQRNK